MIALEGAAKVLDRGEVFRLAARVGDVKQFNGKTAWTLAGHVLGVFTVVVLSDGKREWLGVAKCSVQDYQRKTATCGLKIAIRRAFDRAAGKLTHPAERDYRLKG